MKKLGWAESVFYPGMLWYLFDLEIGKPVAKFRIKHFYEIIGSGKTNTNNSLNP